MFEPNSHSLESVNDNVAVSGHEHDLLRLLNATTLHLLISSINRFVSIDSEIGFDVHVDPDNVPVAPVTSILAKSPAVMLNDMT